MFNTIQIHFINSKGKKRKHGVIPKPIEKRLGRAVMVGTTTTKEDNTGNIGGMEGREWSEELGDVSWAKRGLLRWWRLPSQNWAYPSAKFGFERIVPNSLTIFSADNGAFIIGNIIKLICLICPLLQA